MTREEAHAELEERKLKAKEIGRINNSTLYAGSPMHFYCRYCGLESDCLPESYTERPNHVCRPCGDMEREGYLDK